ncbi:MAG: serine/threonine protein kinase [Planctomycetota bacterium]|jgi:serine/threonine protein kinase
MSASKLNLFDLSPGKTLLDRYLIKRAHRQSGMSAAFEVVDSKDDSRCELQAFPGSLFEGQEQASGFVERISAWKPINNASVLGLRELHLMGDSSVVLVSDFPQGRSLRGWLKESSRMAVHNVARIGLNLLEGLGEIHAAGLVHGDVKPSTIFFREDEDDAVLLDGGITPGLWAAKHMGTRTALIGTPYYAPLEQFSGDAPDVSADLYAIATVLYETITGALPWSGKSFVEVFQSKMMAEPPKMAIRAPGLEIEPELERVIAIGLSAERSKRYMEAEAFRDALSTVALS